MLLVWGPPLVLLVRDTHLMTYQNHLESFKKVLMVGSPLSKDCDVLALGSFLA